MLPLKVILSLIFNEKIELVKKNLRQKRRRLVIFHSWSKQSDTVEKTKRFLRFSFPLCQ